MTRILHIISDDLATGTAKQLELLCRGLRCCGYDTRVCVLARRGFSMDHLPSFGGKTTRCTRNWRTDPSLIARLRRGIGTIDPHLIQTWGYAATAYGRLSATWEGQRPLIASVRSLKCRPRSAEFACTKWLLSQASHITVNNPYIKSFFREFGVDANSIQVVPNGIVVPSSASTVRSLHHELGLPPETVLIGAVGDLRQSKRLRDLIWAMDLLRVIRREVHLVVVGGGNERACLEEYARKVLPAEFVHFLGHRNDVCEILPQLFCLWQASEHSGCSNSVLEAMAAGLPVIASDVAGHRAVLQDGVTGFLVPLGDRAEIARKTNLLLRNRDTASEMGAAGRDHVAKSFTVEAMIAGHQSLYERILSTYLAPRAA